MSQSDLDPTAELEAADPSEPGWMRCRICNQQGPKTGPRAGQGFATEATRDRHEKEHRAQRSNSSRSRPGTHTEKVAKREMRIDAEEEWERVQLTDCAVMLSNVYTFVYLGHMFQADGDSEHACAMGEGRGAVLPD